MNGRRSIGPFSTSGEATSDLLRHIQEQHEWQYRLEEFQRLRK